MPSYVCYADHTAYPRIYRSSYWGNFEGKPKHDSLLKNRNKFVECFDIVAYDNSISKYYKESRLKSSLRSHYEDQDYWYDHQEFYLDRHGRIVHVYSQHRSNGFDPSFKLTWPMYDTCQFTAVKFVETLKSKNKLMKTIFARLPDPITALINEFAVAKKQKTKSKRNKTYPKRWSAKSAFH